MAAYLLVDDFLPVLFVRRIGAVDAAGVTQMLGWVGGHLRSSSKKVGFVYDAGEMTGGLPDAPARRAGGEWLARHQTLLRDKCVGLDFAFASPLSRGALTAVFWVTQPSVPHAIHASLQAAVDSAIGRVGPNAGLEARRVMRDLARRPSR